ncbi:MAG TPA: substrate-binding domain-containing protein [Verrucomicrobiae bacterium]|nr:substrate-binding domain-containing protein [Verrucomicrobiae bacterium]
MIQLQTAGKMQHLEPDNRDCTMHRLPQRNTLSAQAAAILKEGIQLGEWKTYLPGERELSTRLGIGLGTLRIALEQLRRGRVIKSSPGKRHAIISKQGPIRSVVARRVVLLTPQPLHLLQGLVVFWMDSLREQLANAGYQLEVHSGPALYNRQPDAALEACARQLRPIGWILYLSTASMQKWFSDRGLPCVVIGSRQPQIFLPAVDIDHRAVARHAAGLFLARGHRRIVFLSPNLDLAGDKLSEEGFLEGLQAGGRAIEGKVIRYATASKEICSKLDQCIKQSDRPTAFLVGRPLHALTTISYLISRGISVPADTSVISRDDELSLMHMVPSVAHYSCNPTVFAKRISRLVLKMVHAGVVESSQHFQMPDFVSGESLS